MTGGGFVLPGARDDFSDDEEGDRLELSELGQRGPGRREMEWVGKPHVAGPEWMKMPLWVETSDRAEGLIAEVAACLYAD